jgi:hypothetical protein
MNNPFLDPAHPLEYVDGKSVTIHNPKSKPRPRKRPASAVAPRSTRNGNLLWEKGKMDRFTYDTSFARLSKAGYERHPHPREYANFINRFNPPWDDYEWLDVAFQVETSSRSDGSRKRELIVYQGPQDLVFRAPDYKWEYGEQCDKRTTYDVTGLEIEEKLWLSDLPEGFIVDMFGKPYDKLSGRAQNTRVTLPQDDQVSPVCMTGSSLWTYLSANTHVAGSRGVLKVR